MPVSSANTLEHRDVADLLADQFPGHTMQRLRTPDGKYRYIYVSSGIQSTFGLDPDLLMNTEAVDHAWVHPEDRPDFFEALERSARELTPLDVEVRVESHLGTYRWVRSLGRPRRESDGSVIWDGVALDITDRREALDALERALSEAKRHEITEGRFSYIAAQDLSEPLGALRASVAELVAAKAEDREQLDQRITNLSDRFEVFEKALLATRGLVSASASQPASSASGLLSKLTKRQREILDMVRRGASNRDIADHFSISEGTVKLHVSAILKRLGVRNRTEAAQL